MSSMKKAGAFGVVIVAFTVFVLAQTILGSAEQKAPVAATEEQVQKFEELLRVDERVTFDALVTGDVSEFPTIYYNDPTVELNADYNTAIEKAGSAVNEALAGLHNGPKGADTGYLSARTAIIINRQENLAAWESAQATAAAEGREPTLKDMPNSEVPYAHKHADQWVDVPFYVFDGKIQGDHATVKLTYEPPESAALISKYTFTRVDGQWYISGLQSQYNPNPGGLPEGMEAPSEKN